MDVTDTVPEYIVRSTVVILHVHVGRMIAERRPDTFRL